LLLPNHVFQGGIQEHNTATIAGAISTLGLLSFFADFGVFGADETYNQHHIQTGLGSLVANFLAGHGLGIRFRKMGIIRYGGSGKPDDLYRMQGLDVESLVQAVMDEIEKKQVKGNAEVEIFGLNVKN
jgi:transketolase C-terminal domain/subunit